LNRQSFIGALIHILSWGAGYGLTYSLMSHSSNSEVYGFIVAWWMACYVGYIANISIKSGIVAFAIGLLALITSYLTDHSWFYRNPPENINSFFLTIILLNGLLFFSPILFNAIVKKMIKRFRSIASD